MADHDEFKYLKNEIVKFRPLLDGQMVSHLADKLSNESLKAKVNLAGLWLATDQDRATTRLLWGTPVVQEALSRVIALAGALDLALVEQELLNELLSLRFRRNEDHRN